jgi:membrane dipeptidase
MALGAPRKILTRVAAAVVLAACGGAAALHAYERPRLDTAGLGATAGAQDSDLGIDLHAHLFMKPGMAALFDGGFFGPLRATSWRSRFASQANPETLEASGLGIVVVALYANPLFTWSPREAVREEIRQAERFVAEHPEEWVIARSPSEARQALGEGKRVLVLSLERASLILESEEDLKEFIDERGIRIVTMLHLTDDANGGAAFLKGYHQLGNPWRWLSELITPARDEEGNKVNARGLTAKGRELARRLLERGVWLDLSHASDASQSELIPMIEVAGQPLLYTHGALRRFTHTERGISDRQLAEVRRTDGIVGICPSEDELNPTAVPAALCPAACAGSCTWGLPAFVANWSAAAAVVGPENTMLGSDFNGAIPHLHPSCGTGTSLDREGLWNIGQLPALWTAARKLGAPLPARLSDQIESFLQKWARAAR